MSERRVAIVTGAAQGIGLAVAREFARSEYAVVVADINLTLAEQAATEIGSSGGNAGVRTG
jgi:NAD(P)-dependent dehydrogenase (short-subunit alcohol dehydrogenase family)